MRPDEGRGGGGEIFLVFSRVNQDFWFRGFSCRKSAHLTTSESHWRWTRSSREECSSQPPHIPSRPRLRGVHVVGFDFVVCFSKFSCWSISPLRKRLLPSAGDPAMNAFLCDLLMERVCERVPALWLVSLRGFGDLVSIKWGNF